jgi:uncharacterized protein (DUF2461 family)
MTEQDLDKHHFAGFSQQAFSFLKDLKANNDKAWFGTYSRFQTLCTALPLPA